MSRLEWTLGLRYTLVGRGDRFVSFTSLASALGVALGVAAIIVVMSVMNGFHLELRERVLSVSSHVELHGLDGEGAADWRAVLKAVQADARVLAVAPLIDRQGLLTVGDNVRGAVIKGIDPQREGTVADHIDPVMLALLKPGNFQVLLGKRLAARLGVVTGGKVLLLTPSGTRTLGGFVPRFRNMEVVGVVDFGIHNYNSSLLYMHLEDAAKVFRITGIDALRLRLVDVLTAPAVADDLGSAHDLLTLDWTTSNATFFNALAVERRVMFVILSLIIAVAAFQIVAALVTMVRSKRAAIAILRAIGMPPASLLRVFLIQGMLIGVVGTLLGVCVGLLLAANINGFVTLVEQVIGFDFFPAEVYFLEEIPSRIQIADVLATALLAFTLSLLATIAPSLTAARIDPAEALRHE